MRTKADKSGHFQVIFRKRVFFIKKAAPFFTFSVAIFKKMRCNISKRKMKGRAPAKGRIPGKWRENKEALSYTFGTPLAYLSCTFRATSARKECQSPAKRLPKVEIIDPSSAVFIEMD